MGKATLEGTKSFAQKNHSRGFSPDFFTLGDEFCLSSVGFGSYVPEPYKEESYLFSYTDSILQAIKSGSNLIDTAINYRYQQSEREIGKALGLAFTQGVASRDEIVVCSKGGFLPLDYPFPENPFEWIKQTVIDSKLASMEDIAMDQHCMTPEYISWSLDKSLENLGLSTIDVYYLHNPEVQLGFVDAEQFYKKIGDVFVVLESARACGKIGYYGVATWNAFSYEPENLEYISIAKLVQIANDIAGADNGFKFIQMPYNLGKPHAYIYQNQEIEGLFYTPIQAARRLGLNVITSSSLLQMNLFKRPFSDNFRTYIGLDYASDIHRAIQFSRSATGISSSLIGSSSVEHVMHNMEIAKFSRTIRESYEQIFKL